MACVVHRTRITSNDLVRSAAVGEVGRRRGGDIVENHLHRLSLLPPAEPALLLVVELGHLAGPRVLDLRPVGSEGPLIGRGVGGGGEHYQGGGGRGRRH